MLHSPILQHGTIEGLHVHSVHFVRFVPFVIATGDAQVCDIPQRTC
jgi:hypothetical protein